MKRDYVPSNDQQYSSFVDRFNGYLPTNFARLGLTAADVSAMEGLTVEWSTAFDKHSTARVAAEGARDMKNNTRTATTALIRSLVARIQVAPGTTDEDRVALGLNVRSGVPIVGAMPSDERPAPIIDVSQRQRHTIRILNQTLTGAKRGRPAGTIGAEVCVKIGAPPTGIQDMQLLGVALKSPYVVDYTDADAGKQAYYALRWVNSKGEKSAWSETESATIAA